MNQYRKINWYAGSKLFKYLMILISRLTYFIYPKIQKTIDFDNLEASRSDFKGYEWVLFAKKDLRSDRGIDYPLSQL